MRVGCAVPGIQCGLAAGYAGRLEAAYSAKPLILAVFWSIQGACLVLANAGTHFLHLVLSGL